jgi:AcrR family transcriptional regulator
MRISAPSAETETRARILKSALRLFAKSGYEGTTTRDLAEAAGVAEGTLFRYFSTRRQFWWRSPLRVGLRFSRTY